MKSDGEITMDDMFTSLTWRLGQGRWDIALATAEEIIGRYERLSEPTVEEQGLYLRALVGKIIALREMPPRNAWAAWHNLLSAWRAYRRIRRCADAGSPELAAARRAYWRIWFW